MLHSTKVTTKEDAPVGAVGISRLDERIQRTLCVLCFSKFMLFCKFHIVAVVLCFDSFVSVFYFILVAWASADLLFGEPHLE